MLIIAIFHHRGVMIGNLQRWPLFMKTHTFIYLKRFLQTYNFIQLQYCIQLSENEHSFTYSFRREII